MTHFAIICEGLVDVCPDVNIKISDGQDFNIHGWNNLQRLVWGITKDCSTGFAPTIFRMADLLAYHTTPGIPPPVSRQSVRLFTMP